LNCCYYVYLLIEADIKALGIKRWRIKAQDRREWLAIPLREAKAKLKGS
jgi:hypothetical protein